MESSLQGRVEESRRSRQRQQQDPRGCDEPERPGKKKEARARTVATATDGCPDGQQPSQLVQNAASLPSLNHSLVSARGPSQEAAPWSASLKSSFRAQGHCIGTDPQPRHNRGKWGAADREHVPRITCIDLSLASSEPQELLTCRIHPPPSFLFSPSSATLPPIMPLCFYTLSNRILVSWATPHTQTYNTDLGRTILLDSKWLEKQTRFMIYSCHYYFKNSLR